LCNDLSRFVAIPLVHVGSLTTATTLQPPFFGGQQYALCNVHELNWHISCVSELGWGVHIADLFPENESASVHDPFLVSSAPARLQTPSAHTACGGTSPLSPRWSSLAEAKGGTDRRPPLSQRSNVSLDPIWACRVRGCPSGGVVKACVLAGWWRAVSTGVPRLLQPPAAAGLTGQDRSTSVALSLCGRQQEHAHAPDSAPPRARVPTHPPRSASVRAARGGIGRSHARRDACARVPVAHLVFPLPCSVPSARPCACIETLGDPSVSTSLQSGPGLRRDGLQRQGRGSGRRRGVCDR